jgi:hypothetical protein
VSSEAEDHPISLSMLDVGMAREGFMRMVQINGRSVDCKWARIIIRFMDVRGLRLITDLKLPCGYQVMWEFQTGEEQELMSLKGIIVRQNGLLAAGSIHEYEAKFIMNERHPLIVQRNESYSESSRKRRAWEGLKVDLLG